MQFKDLKTAVSEQFTRMQQFPLFRTDTNKDVLWSTYLESFPEGTNPIYRERREYDCQCCRQFIRAVGNVVAISPNGLITLWDITVPDFQPVVDALADYVKEMPIYAPFYHNERSAGTDYNYAENATRWEHFYLQIPAPYYRICSGELISAARGVYDVTKRSLDSFSIETVDTVLELLPEIYRGAEHKHAVTQFRETLLRYDGTHAFCWLNSCPIRNTVIGSLLIDIEEGKGIEEAVKSFEAKVAPANYKRPKSIVTAGMIKKAEAAVTELGFLDSLPRRHATLDDIAINNVLFANRDVKESKGIFEQMIAEAPVSVGKPVPVSLDSFLSDVLPNSSVIEIMDEKRHAGNKVTLVAPVNPDAPSMLKWGNNFSWTYTGDVADSMKQRVKDAGGAVDGDLRFSIQWNDSVPNMCDLDAHCQEPRTHIYYPSKGERHPSSGMLDVDVIQPSGPAVENITWSNKNHMPIGTYSMYVDVYSRRNGSLFEAEIEFDGELRQYRFEGNLHDKIRVADVMWDGKSFSVVDILPSSKVGTGTFEKVSVVMLSPNHWDGSIGNKHIFFMVEGMKQEGNIRGFYNEFLDEALTPHRKVFETLASKMSIPYKDDQLTGLGFSHNETVICRVDGKTYEVTI